MDEIELIESVIGLDALYDSMLKCIKGVLWKDSVASFFLRAGENISKLHRELQDGTYKAKPPKHFKITSPKPREIALDFFHGGVCHVRHHRVVNELVHHIHKGVCFQFDSHTPSPQLSFRGPLAARGNLLSPFFCHSEARSAVGISRHASPIPYCLIPIYSSAPIADTRKLPFPGALRTA